MNRMGLWISLKNYKMEVKQKAPDFALKDNHGNLIRLRDFKGSYVVLYFYPKDMTPGCTTEACDLRDNYERLKGKNVAILGVSMDDRDSHENFRKRYSLPFPLLCDMEGEVVRKYGVFQRKSFFGKKVYGIKRTTFIIDTQGRIHSIIKDVDVKNHAQQIINALHE